MARYEKYILYLVYTKTLADMYLVDITSGTTAKLGEPKIVKETVATALVDGNNVLGKI